MTIYGCFGAIEFYRKKPRGEREMTTRLIEKHGQIEIWEVSEAYGLDFYVYGVRSDPVVCPSLGMAREVAASVE